MALEFKRRSVAGLHFPDQLRRWARAMTTRFLTLRRDNPLVRNDGAEGDVTHAAEGATSSTSCRSARASAFGGNVNGVVDRIIGGWQIGGNAESPERATRRLRQRPARRHGRKTSCRACTRSAIDDQRRVWMLPEAIINESVKAFSVDPTSPTGYSTLGPPSGKYIAPADSIDCIETDSRLGRLRLALGGADRTDVQAVRYRHHQARAALEPDVG